MKRFFMLCFLLVMGAVVKSASKKSTITCLVGCNSWFSICKGLLNGFKGDFSGEK
jgi:hypothetical protein